LPATTYLVEIISTSYGCGSSAYSSSFTTIGECIVPNNISVSYNTTEVTISWDDLPSASTFDILYNFGQGYNITTTSSNTITLSLNGASNNVFYVRSNCTDGQQSEWSDLQSFSVSCNTPTDLSITNSGTDVTLDWQGTSSLYKLVYNYGTGWNVVYPTTSDYQISNVPIGSTVTVYIRAICDQETNFVSPWLFDTYFTVSGGKMAIDQEWSFDLYPNPSRGLVSMQISSVSDKMDIQIKLIDAFGKEVYFEQKSIKNDTEILEVDLHHLAKGIYFLQIISANDVKSERLILQ
jgi:hypothetical protein